MTDGRRTRGEGSIFQRALNDDELAGIAAAVADSYGVPFDLTAARAVAEWLSLYAEVDEYAEGMSASRIVEAWSKDQ